MQNPVVRGFNPDPSIIRIGEDYYIATSTFEWFPGVNIYHSKDLKNRELHSRVLNDERFVNLDGVPDGGGIWAPCLSYDGKKYLVSLENHYEKGKRFNGSYVDGKMLASADAKILTDEHVHLGFTGAMMGINCIDCEKRVKKALYKYFKYERN